MADLDDFFAKKDRKKKTTKKFTTTDEVAKKLEDTAKKTEKPKKERVPEGEESNNQAQEQDEWKDFEEEKKDYTNLKIGNLTIDPNEESNASNQESGAGDQSEGGETGPDGERKVAGPWKRMENQQDHVVVPEEAPKPVEKKPDPPAATTAGGVYRPPGYGQRSTQSSQPAPQVRLRGNRNAAPDIHNEDFFPTLAKSSDKKNKSEGNFEVVQRRDATSRNKLMEQRGAGGGELSLGNRYKGLDNES